MLRTALLWVLSLIFLISGSWYFFLKTEDYSINFNTSAPAGRIAHKLKNWKFQHLEDVKVSEKEVFHFLSQTAQLDRSPVELSWKFSTKNDSLTRVRIEVTHADNKFRKRLALLFSTPDFQKKIKKDILKFKKALQADSDFFKVKVLGPDKIPETTCACIPLKSKMDDKAFEMKKNINILSDYLLKYELEMAARPRVDITSWNKSSEDIKFDFCFPLKKTEKEFPETSRIFIKTIPEKAALKAIFNGNYMYSHQAWMELIRYAKREKIKTKAKILEVFNSNPEMGGNTLHWEAEIYIQVRN